MEGAARIAVMATLSEMQSAWREGLPDDAQKRLNGVRMALVAGEILLMALAVGLLQARLPWAALAWIVALQLLLVLLGQLRRRQGGIAASEAVGHLAADAALLAGLVYLTGGYANPFISLLLVPLILSAALLPGLYVWVMATWVGGLYTVLMSYFAPLVLQVSQEAAVNLHLRGMWLNFLITAVLVAAFAGQLAAALRRRDRQLSQVREQRLRDEQLFALGLQAAAAAHDLATPLGSVRLTLDELRLDYAGDDELAAPLVLMSEQLARAESVLSHLGEAARARASVAGPPLPAGRWLARVVEHWGLMRPQARVDLHLPAGLPELEDDATLETVLVTLLNNAADASPQGIRLAAEWRGNFLQVTIADQGAGLGGDKAAGWGVGLELARAALERAGGHLSVVDGATGGVEARLSIPLASAGDGP